MRQRDSELGFSLVEMVIAIFLLGVLAMATLPLLLATTQNSAFNRDLNIASSHANSVITEIRAQYPDGSSSGSCAQLQTIAESAAEVVAAQHFSALVTLGSTCPTAASAFPLAMPLTVTVTSVNGNASSTATTQVYVGAP